MKKLFFVLLAYALTYDSMSQEKYFTKNGTIRIDATTNASLETIRGINRSVSAVLVTQTGKLLFIVLMKGFEFQKALMQEHFNENYVESDKYPKADFKGQVQNIDEIDFKKNGSYPVNVKGQLTMHGRTNPIEATGSIQVRDGKLLVNSTFSIALKDYNITIPGLVADKVSKTVGIIVECFLDPFKK